MTERRGDIPFEELLNEGEVQLNEYMPDESNRACDLTEAMARSPLRQSVYFGKRLYSQHASTRTDDPGNVELPARPNYVVQLPIEVDIEGERVSWQYNVRPVLRVFSLRDQFLTLDLEETLRWLSASKGPEVTEATKTALEAEVALGNVNNGRILQAMYERIENGNSMLPFIPGSPKE